MLHIAQMEDKGKGILFNVGGQTGKDCLLTWVDGVKVADRRDRTRNLSLRKRRTNHLHQDLLSSYPEHWAESPDWFVTACAF